MAIIKCNNGHFYDDAVYHGKCPHCKAESELLKEGKEILEDDRTVAMSLDQIHIHTNYSDKTGRRQQRRHWEKKVSWVSFLTTGFLG